MISAKTFSSTIGDTELTSYPGELFASLFELEDHAVYHDSLTLTRRSRAKDLDIRRYSRLLDLGLRRERFEMITVPSSSAPETLDVIVEVMLTSSSPSSSSYCLSYSFL